MQCTHDNFFSYLQTVIPELNTATNVYIVTDGELAITGAISHHFPQLQMFRCWNHAIQVRLIIKQRQIC